MPLAGGDRIHAMNRVCTKCHQHALFCAERQSAIAKGLRIAEQVVEEQRASRVRSRIARVSLAREKDHHGDLARTDPLGLVGIIATVRVSGEEVADAIDEKLWFLACVQRDLEVARNGRRERIQTRGDHRDHVGVDARAQRPPNLDFDLPRLIAVVDGCRRHFRRPYAARRLAQVASSKNRRTMKNPSRSKKSAVGIDPSISRHPERPLRG